MSYEHKDFTPTTGESLQTLQQSYSKVLESITAPVQFRNREIPVAELKKIVELYATNGDARITPELIGELAIPDELKYLAGELRSIASTQVNIFEKPESKSEVVETGTERPRTNLEIVTEIIKSSAPEVDVRGWTDVDDAIKAIATIPTQDNLRERVAQRLIQSAVNFEELRKLATEITSPIESPKGPLTTPELFDEIRTILESETFQSAEFQASIAVRNEEAAQRVVLDQMPQDFTNRFSLRETVARCIVTSIKAKYRS